jgi:hypothetical protein
MEAEEGKKLKPQTVAALPAYQQHGFIGLNRHEGTVTVELASGFRAFHLG